MTPATKKTILAAQALGECLGADHEHDEDGGNEDENARWSARSAAARADGLLHALPCAKDTAVYVNAHCHAFQRALRSEGGDFWAWRESMLELAARQTPESVRATYADVYRELRAAGWAAVGEFHYLGLAEAFAAVEAAAEAGIEIVLLHVAYARGGIERFRQESVAAYLRELEELRAAGVRVGVTPHSVRACPR